MSGHYGYMQMPYDTSQLPQMVASPSGSGPYAGGAGGGNNNVSGAPPHHSHHLQQQQQQQQQLPPLPQLAGVGSTGSSEDPRKRKYDSEQDDDEDGDSKGPREKRERSGASDFVKKLYKMLEEGQFPDVVCWGETGDSFVVKDMNTFTKTILPLHFKHSNFASFVRQLNKYDFHKVKANTGNEDGSGAQQQQQTNQFGEQIWEFKHPNFKADMKESLEHIRRKAPAKTGKGGKSKGTDSPTPHESYASQGDVAALQAQIDSLHRGQQQAVQHLNSLGQDYAALFGEMMSFQRNMVAQDQLMQHLIQYLLNLEQDQAQEKQFVPSSQAQKLISSYTSAARASYDQMADFSRRASMSGQNLPAVPMPPPTFGQFSFPNDSRDQNGYQQQQQQQQGQSHQFSQAAPSNASQSQQHQSRQSTSSQQTQSSGLAQDNRTGSTSGPASAAATPHANSNNSSGNGGTSTAAIQHPGASRPALVPGWGVPPRVLLVEDDAVCRKLSSKFLQLFGCEIDVAVDGVSAVNKMNSQKYDLVLMDIMMPNLDGVSATSLIRQFDADTPIISMTSNSSPNEIMTYFSHGMNDILPKPFTKEGLLDMLEKHLLPFKVVQQMAEIPRALGFTQDQIHDALAVSVVTEEGGNVMNPFSSMGISDTDYVEMLQGVARESEGKRAIEVVHDGPAGENSRARFALYDQ